MPESGGGEAKPPSEPQHQRSGKRRNHPRSGGRRRRRRTSAYGGVDEDGDGSPDGLFYYSCSSDHHSGHRGGSLFSPSSSSVAAANLAGGRCSFGSDRDGAFLPLAGRELSGGSAPGPGSASPGQGPSCSAFPLHDQCYCHRPTNPSKGTEDLVQRQEGQQVVLEEEEESLDQQNHFASKVVEECKNLKNRSKAPRSASGKPQRLRPASIDFNLSPRLIIGSAAGMPKSSAASSQSRSGTFPSPGTPNYRHGAGAAVYQKGWSSERVPLPAHSNRSYGGGGVFLPFNNGRALPSKWEDAEKWILSPVSGDGTRRSSVPPTHLRRPKSKSGPLGTPAGITKAYSAASPIMPCFDSGLMGSFTANSPFLAGVLMAEQGYGGNRKGGKNGDTGKGGGGATDDGVMRSFSGDGEPYMGRSSSVHGWSDALIESSSSLPSSRDDKSEATREAGNVVSPSDTKKDAATQMSPEGSTPTSPNQDHSFSRSQLANCMGQLENHFSKLEVRDVQMDDQVTMTRWSKKHVARGSSGRSMNIIDWKKRTVEAETSSWGATESARVISKYKREEAKITAWENLQKAKAEAEIRKLEMKLEKKRSSSMDKILNKLKSAQKRAQDMRNSVNARQANQVVKTPKRISYFPKAGQISSLSGCFTCHSC